MHVCDDENAKQIRAYDKQERGVSSWYIVLHVEEMLNHSGENGNVQNAMPDCVVIVASL